MRQKITAQRSTIGGDPATYADAPIALGRAQRECEQETMHLDRDRQRHSAVAAELARLEAAVEKAKNDEAAALGLSSI